MVFFDVDHDTGISNLASEFFHLMEKTRDDQRPLNVPFDHPLSKLSA